MPKHGTQSCSAGIRCFEGLFKCREVSKSVIKFNAEGASIANAASAATEMFEGAAASVRNADAANVFVKVVFIKYVIIKFHGFYLSINNRDTGFYVVVSCRESGWRGCGC